MHITECPRDAMQSHKNWIPTADKIDYINALMSVGYDVLDCGSFVSPKSVPQMKDTAEVLSAVDKSASQTQLSAIVASVGGAERALKHKNLDILGFPFSISEVFQQKNTEKSRGEALREIEEILSMLKNEDKVLNVYISMAFGNPYGEQWHLDEVLNWVERLAERGVGRITLSDTIGVSTQPQISEVLKACFQKFPQVDFGVHFHCEPSEAYDKLFTSYSVGCMAFDVAIKGLGGCPIIPDKKGNLPTEKLLNFLAVEKVEHRLNLLHFESAWNKAKNIFNF